MSAPPPVSAASFDTIQSFPLSARPTCPTILIPFERELYSLPVHDLRVSAEFHVSTAFVKVTGSWRNIAIFPSDCMFVLPLNGTVTKASIRVKDRLFETVVLPRDSAQEVQMEGARKNPKPAAAPAAGADGAGEKGVMPQQSDFESYIPNLFRLPIPNVGSGDEIQVTVHYIEPLFFQDGRYTITLPLKFGSNLLADGKSFNDVIKLDCVLNAVTDSTSYESSSHKLQFEKREGTRIHVRAVNIEGKRPDASTDEALAQDPNFMQSTDFAFSYSLSSQEILCTLFKEEAKDDQRSEGTFALFVTPPSAPASGSLARDVIFLLDRSGSMTGDPFIEATRALAVALEQLRPGDRFNIISFDHRQEYYRKELVAPTPANVAEATDWVRSLQPERGGTDIHTPLQYSLDLLNSQNTHGAGSLPFVVLLTDGCVQNEREICQFASTHAGNVRVLTFGIGFFCNWFFLKMLAQIGRGFSDVVVYKEKIYDQMLQLLNMAAVPVLTHISVKIEGLPNMELWPDPVPDLFMGAPLTVAGRYSGAFPQSVRVQGKLPNGNSFDAVVPVVQSDVVPVGKVFLKQRIDLLTAKAWFKDSKQLQEQVVDLSCTHSMPSAYTTMVAFETDEERRRQLEEARDYGEPDGFVHVDGDGQEAKLMGSGLRKSSSSPDIPSKKKWYRNPKFIAGLTIGTTAVVGAVAFSFGDVAASVANVPVIGSLADVFHGGGCCGDCGCDGCGSCDCSGCDVGGCGGCSIA